MTNETDNRMIELEQSKYKPPYDARPMRMLRHHIERDCLASRRGVLREIEDLFAIELTKRDERIAELEQAIAATLGGGECECVWNEQEGTFHCSSCNTLLTSEVSIEWPSHKITPITLPNYCHNCGKAVKR